MSNRFKKWFLFVLGVVLGVFMAIIAKLVILKTSNALYDRSGLEEQVYEKFVNRTFDDIAVDELVINAYEFNEQEPRFYSKYFRKNFKGTHDVLLREAMGGSGAAPIYFDP
jgi:patatin-like phospholipase/acyl hydrolase